MALALRSVSDGSLDVFLLFVLKQISFFSVSHQIRRLLHVRRLGRRRRDWFDPGHRVREARSGETPRGWETRQKNDRLRGTSTSSQLAAKWKSFATRLKRLRIRTLSLSGLSAMKRLTNRWVLDPLEKFRETTQASIRLLIYRIFSIRLLI